MTVARLTPAVLTSEVGRAISTAAERTGIDFGYLYAQAKSESGLNPTVKAATSSASGLYQFIDQSWLGIVKQHGSEHGFGWAADAIHRGIDGRWHVEKDSREAVFALRQQAGPAALMAAEYASDNAAGLSKTLGRTATGTDLYFAHFLGLGGAKKFLTRMADDPDATAAAAFPKEARVNRTLFYTRTGEPRSLGALYKLMGDKLAKAGATSDAPGQSAPQLPQLQYAKAAIAPEPEAGKSEDVGERLAAIGQTRVDVLRPSPQNARLAYLMLQSQLLG